MLSPTTLTFTVFALVLGERPLRTGALVLPRRIRRDAADRRARGFRARQRGGAQPLLRSARDRRRDPRRRLRRLLLGWVPRALRRPADPRRIAGAVEKMSAVASSPAIAIVAAGATLANPGGFIPIALKSISQADPSTTGVHPALGGFGLIALLPLVIALLALAVAPRSCEGGARPGACVARAPRPHARGSDHRAARRGPDPQRHRRAHLSPRTVRARRKARPSRLRLCGVLRFLFRAS